MQRRPLRQVGHGEPREGGEPRPGRRGAEDSLLHSLPEDVDGEQDEEGDEGEREEDLLLKVLKKKSKHQSLRRRKKDNFQKRRRNTRLPHLHPQFEAPRQHQRVQARGLEEDGVRDRHDGDEPAEEAREGGAERAAAAASPPAAAATGAVAALAPLVSLVFFFLFARGESRRVDPLFG